MISLLYFIIGMNKNMKKLILFILLFTFFSTSQNAFTMENSKVYFSGPNFSIAPESEFLISILLDAKDPINAFDLEIAYPPDKLKFLSFDNMNSIVDIWQAPPSVLPNGNLKLSGGIIKAFNGNTGLIIKLSFQALNPSESQLSFVKSNLYIADGKGTEVKTNPETFSISVKENGKIISSPAVPFQSTPTDILIEKELKGFKSDMFWKRIFTPTLIFFVILVIILLVIFVKAVYNKFKRKL